MKNINSYFILSIGSLILLSTVAVFAQGVDAATLQVSTSYLQFKSFAKAVSAICALIGGLKAYNKFQNGDPEFKRGILVWFGAAAFSMMIPSILDALFR